MRFSRCAHRGGAGGAGQAQREEDGGADAFEAAVAGGPDLNGCLHTAR